MISFFPFCFCYFPAVLTRFTLPISQHCFATDRADSFYEGGLYLHLTLDGYSAYSATITISSPVTLKSLQLHKWFICNATASTRHTFPFSGGFLPHNLAIQISRQVVEQVLLGTPLRFLVGWPQILQFMLLVPPSRFVLVLMLRAEYLNSALTLYPEQQ